jgi:hypothetical protein
VAEASSERTQESASDALRLPLQAAKATRTARVRTRAAQVTVTLRLAEPQATGAVRPPVGVPKATWRVPLEPPPKATLRLALRKAQPMATAQ